MACACKVNQEIEKIHKYYSYSDKSLKKPKMTINKKDAVITILIYILLLPLVPFMFIFLLFYSLFSKSRKISMRKFLGFIHKTRNGRKKQNI